MIYKKAYSIAHALVTKFCMSERVGLIGFAGDEYVKKYSEATSRIIDEEIKRIIDECTVTSCTLVRKYQPQILKLLTTLLEKETLDLNQITAILGERPFTPKAASRLILKQRKI